MEQINNLPVLYLGEAVRQLFFPELEEFKGENANKKGNWYGITLDQFNSEEV